MKKCILLHIISFFVLPLQTFIHDNCNLMPSQHARARLQEPDKQRKL